MSDEQTEQPIEWIKARVIETKGRSVLVEVEGPRRYYVPRAKVKDGQVEPSTLDKAIEYGIRWETFLEQPDVTPTTLAALLRQAGIWTREDLTRLDRKLIRIGTNIIGKAVFGAADRAAQNKPPRRKNDG